jgi:hypothetical protein
MYLDTPRLTKSRFTVGLWMSSDDIINMGSTDPRIHFWFARATSTLNQQAETSALPVSVQALRHCHRTSGGSDDSVINMLRFKFQKELFDQIDLTKEIKSPDHKEFHMTSEL